MSTVTLDLLHAIHPMVSAMDALKSDLQELEAAGFLKADKDNAGTWTFAQVGTAAC